VDAGGCLLLLPGLHAVLFKHGIGLPSSALNDHWFRTIPSGCWWLPYPVA